MFEKLIIPFHRKVLTVIICEICWVNEKSHARASLFIITRHKVTIKLCYIYTAHTASRAVNQQNH